LFINQFTATSLRSLEFIALNPNKHINIILGKNNAGKTSVLEGIFYTSSLKSFKSVPPASLVANNSKCLKILVKFTKSNDNVAISIEKSLKSPIVKKINDKRVSAKQLLEAFPVLALNFGSSNVITGSSEERRLLLDWGSFHVEHSYLDLYKDFNKSLKQRNSLLKKNDLANIEYWTDLVSELGTKLHNTRNAYFNELSIAFEDIKAEMQELLPNIYNDIKKSKISYFPGWSKSLSLKDSLNKTLPKDTVLKHTTTGPHRADISFAAGNNDLKSVSSMSTQIISTLLVILSQARVFHVKHEHSPIILIDDLFFGIDDKNLQLVINLLKSSRAQCFITAPDLYRDKLEDIIGNKNVQMYMFENNNLMEINNDK